MLAGMKKPSRTATARELFGKNLRRARRWKNISQEALALQADLSRTYVSDVERGERNVSIDNMEILANAVGFPLHALLNPKMVPMPEGDGGSDD
jgi:transcriptional regulator with XRE-family HTH domain